MPSGGIGITIMATQASAIIFLSTPGQAYTDGLIFTILFGITYSGDSCVTFVPIFIVKAF